MLLEVVTLLSTLTPFGSADCTAHRHCSMVFIRQHSRQQRLPLPPNVGQQIDGIKSVCASSMGELLMRKSYLC
ncbi:hypothetical protein BDZ97DRAFT_184796 [Flammula alnicola]|nr:hypothetical protein BDZ97DRAFT_184796 [Flammula alnicola]